MFLHHFMKFFCNFFLVEEKNLVVNNKDDKWLAPPQAMKVIDLAESLSSLKDRKKSHGGVIPLMLSRESPPFLDYRI